MSSFLKKANHKATAEICGKRINRGYGLGLELPVIYKIYGGRKYSDRLNELIYGSETAKRALREKDEGVLIDGQKKRKSTKKDKVSKSRKNRLDMYANIPRCCPVSAITREKTIKLSSFTSHNPLRLGSNLSDKKAKDEISVYKAVIYHRNLHGKKNHFCCAPSCSNNRKRNPNPKFYRIPKESKQRNAWLNRIRRQDFAPTDNTRLCSAHFVGGEKSDDPAQSAYNPSIFEFKREIESRKTRTSQKTNKDDFVAIETLKSKCKRVSVSSSR